MHVFHKGQTIIIGERFVAKIVNFGSLILDRNLDQNYPAGTTVRAITPQDACGVDGVGGQNAQSTQNNQRITNQIGDRSTATDLRTENANATNTLSHATTPQECTVWVDRTHNQQIESQIAKGSQIRSVIGQIHPVY